MPRKTAQEVLDEEGVPNSIERAEYLLLKAELVAEAGDIQTAHFYRDLSSTWLAMNAVRAQQPPAEPTP